MNKKLIAPICTMTAALVLGVGSTWALFSSKSSSEVEITSGKVAVDYSASLTKALSRYEDDVPYDAIANRVEPHAATFENGSTADISVDSSSALITLDRLTPMDMVQVKVGATNDSNVNIKFRYFIKASGDLLPALDLFVDNAPLQVNDSVIEFYSAWSSVMTPNVESLFEKNIEIYFPDHGDDFDNLYQDKAASIEVGIEAVQGNARVVNQVDPTPVAEEEEIHSSKPSAAGKSVNIESQTGSQSYIVPFEACDENAQELVLTITPEEEPAVEVPAGKDFLAYDVNIEGIKENNTAEIDAKIGIGQGKTNVQVFHDGAEIDSTYVEDEGAVHFKATSFSPYDVLFDSALESGYGFHNSYLVDEGLETEHWVHEITNIDEFRNIVDDTVHSKKTEAHGYPGSLNEDTVYLIKNDIDFGGGEIWNTQELINLVNAYPFMGKLVGSGEGVTLSNVHVTTLYNGIDNNSTSCFFGRAINASFENLTISNCSINNTSADKAAILVAGNKTKVEQYRTLFNDPSFEMGTVSFKNILIDETCSVVASENGAGVVACLRYLNGVYFEGCVNKASITSATNNVAGIAGQISNNPVDGTHTSPVSMINCENYGEIFGDGRAVGGVVGYFCAKYGVMENCKNFGNVNHPGSGNVSGSIAGEVLTGAKFENCYNEGTVYTTGSLTDYNSANTVVLYGDKTEVSLDDKNEYLSLYKKVYTGNIIDVTLDKTNWSVNVDTTDGADHYSMIISTSKVDIDASTNKAVPQRSGSILIDSFDNLSATEVNNFKIINQMGYFAPDAQTECPVDEYHGGTRIGSRGEFVTSTYFLDYSHHGQEGYAPGYGTNSKGGYFILDNTGTVDFWPCLITWRPNVTYSVIGYDAQGAIVSTGKVVYAPFTLGGDNNYTTEIVGYVPEVK